VENTGRQLPSTTKRSTFGRTEGVTAVEENKCAERDERKHTPVGRLGQYGGVAVSESSHGAYTGRAQLAHSAHREGIEAEIEAVTSLTGASFRTLAGA